MELKLKIKISLLYFWAANIVMAYALAKIYKKSCNKADIKIKKRLDKQS